MAAVLKSKVFVVPKGKELNKKAIMDWVKNLPLKNEEEYTLLMELKLFGCQRRRKKMSEDEYDALVTKEITAGKTEWKKGDYSFDFRARSFSWGGNNLHITINEAIFLFRWLVLKENVCEVDKQYLYQMKARHSKFFLAEVDESGRYLMHLGPGNWIEEPEEEPAEKEIPVDYDFMDEEDEIDEDEEDLYDEERLQDRLLTLED